MKYFNRVMDIRRMEADEINKRTGATSSPRAMVDKAAMRALLDDVVGPCLKGEALVAYGAREKRKGGVHKGGVFITGEVARGRGVTFVTVGGSRLVKG
jgi:hypothetical protein